MTLFLPLKLILMNILVTQALKSFKPQMNIMETAEIEEEYEDEIYCKHKSSLIRLERNADIYPVDTYINSSISLECKYCEEKDDGLPKNWSYQKHIFTGNVTEIEWGMESDEQSSKIFVTKYHSLVIRNVQEKDMGLYFCRAPYVDKLEKSFNYLLDLTIHSVDDIKGSLQTWKNYSEQYLKPLNRKFAAEDTAFVNYMRINITLFTHWSDWSSCDACSPTPTHFRKGRCRVKPVCEDPKKCFDKHLMENDTFFDDKHNIEITSSVESGTANSGTVKKDMIQFAISLSCKSLLLKNLLPKVYRYTKDVPDFILVSNCTGPCKGRISSKGARYKRSVILTESAHLTLVCPDSTIDSEVRWEHNKRRLYPNEGLDYVAGSIEPRIYVDSFNTLYLFEVTEEESGTYTCYVDGFQMQEVSVIVLQRSVYFTKEFRRHLNYLAIVFLICFVVYLSGITMICVRKRNEERSRGRARHMDETVKLLNNE